MKYTIFGFSQKKACDYKLDLYDLAILRWIADFFPRMSKITIDSEVYVWVNYKQLILDIPIMNIKKDTVYRRLKKMCENNILKHYTVKKGGTYSYYALSAGYLLLVDDEGYGNKSEGYGNKSEGYGNKSKEGTEINPEQNNSSINNSSIKQCVLDVQHALTQQEYNKLISKYRNNIDVVNSKVERALKYKGCNNLSTIENWIIEEIKKRKNEEIKSVTNNRFNNFHQRDYSQSEMDELEKRLLSK